METMKGGVEQGDYKRQLGVHNQRDITIQIILSLVLGFAAFIAFCFLRTRWPGLYSARKRQRDEASPLPELPNTFFGWIPALWKVTEQQILASAGLDAYVFLRFFKLATKFLVITLFFSLIVFKPVHDAFPEQDTSKDGKKNSTTIYPYQERLQIGILRKDKGMYEGFTNDYLWMYLIFAYLFTALVMYLLVTETERIISVRQEFLGSRQTVTDRTIRLSGIPPSLRSEDKIKEYIENLQIGNVDSVTLCAKWQELDDLMEQRTQVLRKLEESWTVYLGHRRVERNLESLPVSQPSPPDTEPDQDDGTENEPLLPSQPNGHSSPVPYKRSRPMLTVRSGFLKIRSKQFDAIDYYEIKLSQLDSQIEELREKDFQKMPLAFVTMDSVAACQMAVQAVLDPSPMQLIAKPSPSPADVVWRNTYLPRWTRMTRSWLITLAIGFLTVFWSIILVAVAAVLRIDSIHKWWPQLADALRSHPLAASLVTAQLPTLITSLLFVIVPYLYDWLSNLQGMTSQGDIDMSVTAKNFFFVFFNYFIIFSVLGTFANFYSFFERFRDSLQDTTKIAYTLATSLQGLLPFYTNLIILQGLGLFPFRLLEFGSVALYPINRIGCKTPRDYAELVQPPVFYYGFYLPYAMLIFIICMVYSILRDSWMVLLSGLLYFVIGRFVYQYQLLYAMDHRQQATGKAWNMICNRVIIGLLLFQLTMAGQLGFKGAPKRSAVIAPLLVATIWFSYVHSNSYNRLMSFISLGSIERRRENEPASPVDPDGWEEQARLRYEAETRPGHTVDESSESGTRYVNPSLVAPLEDVWITDKDTRTTDLRSDQTNRRRLEGALNAAV